MRFQSFSKINIPTQLIPLLVFVFSLCAGPRSLPAQDLEHIFRAGDLGYACFRIPAIIATSQGTLLAFAEARRNHCGDAADIDLVLRRSADGGKTWGPITIVWDDGDNTCGNPALVIDKRNGRIHLLTTWNLGIDREQQIINQTSKDTRRIFTLHSDDDGFTWTPPREITTDVKLNNWTWYATGPGNGIQISTNRYAGRLMIPCDHIEAGTKKYFSHVIYSDDGGTQWHLGGSTPTDQVNECAVAEIDHGKLLLNMRNYNQLRYRQTSVSRDGGVHWSALKQDTALSEPVCQAAMIAVRPVKGKRYLVFSNPASQRARERMTIKISYNNGRSWKKSLLLHPGPAAYSGLVVLPNGHLGCLFEAGWKSPYEGIVFREITDF